MLRKKYACPCCGYYTLSEQPPGTFDICEVCYWEDDAVQFTEPNYEGGANQVSLNQARENFTKLGAVAQAFVVRVRPPREEEKPV